MNGLTHKEYPEAFHPGQHARNRGPSVPMHDKAPGHGVRPQSQGPLFPATIALVESYATFPAYTAWYESLRGNWVTFSEKSNYAAALYAVERDAFYAQPLDARLRYRAHVLSLDGHSERYSSHEEAEQVAEYLLRFPEARKAWVAGRGSERSVPAPSAFPYYRDIDGMHDSVTTK